MVSGQNWHKEVGTWKGERQAEPNVKHNQRLEFYKDRVKYKLHKEFDDVVNNLTQNGFATLEDHRSKGMRHKIEKGDTLFVILKNFYKDKFGFDSARSEKEAYLSLAHVMKATPPPGSKDNPTGNVDELKVGGEVAIDDGHLIITDPVNGRTMWLAPMRPESTETDALEIDDGDETAEDTSVEPTEDEALSEDDVATGEVVVDGETSEEDTGGDTATEEDVPLDIEPDDLAPLDAGTKEKPKVTVEDEQAPAPEAKENVKVLTEEESKTFSGIGKLTFTTPKPGTYEGAWHEGKWHGHGTLKYDDGEVYSGKFENGFENDEHGVLQFSDGSVYIGGFEKGSRKGQGRLVRPDGTVEEGKWIGGNLLEDEEVTEEVESAEETDNFVDLDKFSDKKLENFTGKGKMTYENGTYEGDWSEGLRTGKGKYSWKEGDIYEGDWLDGVLHGKGIYKYENGEVYNGDWINDEKSGKGTYSYKNGNVYTGEWDHGYRSGIGILKFADGTYYEGAFMDDKMTGRGTRTYDNGIYKGYFENGYRNGEGSYQWSSGERYEGSYKLDKLDGRGAFLSKDNQLQVGEFKDNKFISGVTRNESGEVVANYEEFSTNINEWLKNSGLEGVTIAATMSGISLKKNESEAFIKVKFDETRNTVIYTMESLEGSWVPADGALKVAAAVVFIEDEFKKLKPEAEFKSNPYYFEGNSVLFHEENGFDNEVSLPAGAEGINAEYISRVLNERFAKTRDLTTPPPPPPAPEKPEALEPATSTEDTKIESEVESLPYEKIESFINEDLKLSKNVERVSIIPWERVYQLKEQIPFEKGFQFAYRDGWLIIPQNLDKTSIFYYNPTVEDKHILLLPKMTVDENIDLILK